MTLVAKLTIPTLCVQVTHPAMQKDLLGLEKQESSVNFKIGVIYARGGQILDDEILSNARGSPEFEDFLSLLGQKIQLKGWENYRWVIIYQTLLVLNKLADIKIYCVNTVSNSSLLASKATQLNAS